MATTIPVRPQVITKHDPMGCGVCLAIDRNPTAHNTDIALEAGVGEATVRRHRQTPHPPIEPYAPFADIPTEIITSRGRSIRTENGWEKITYQPQAAALLKALDYNDIAEYLDSRPTTQPTTQPPAPYTAVLGLADLQIGKTQETGGTKETIDRVLKAVDTFTAYCEATRPSEIVVAELGDVLEGFDNVATQRATNDLDLTSQVRTARRVLLEVLARVKDAAPTITFVSVPSNHAQVRIPGSKDFASNPANDWGIELSHQLEDVLRYRDGWDHVQLLRPEGKYAEALTHTTTSGVKLGMVHGHQANRQTNLGTWWQGQAMGRRHGLHEADVLLYGHYHNLRVETLGDSRWLVGLPSPDPGSDWYTNKTGNAASPGLLAFDLSPGPVPWRNLRVL